MRILMKGRFSILLILILSGCVNAGRVPLVPLAERHQPSGRWARFSYSNLSFKDYIQFSREMIAASRTDLNDNNRDAVIDGNSPFELDPPSSCPPGKSKRFARGILMTHGLTDSPFSTRALGDFFQAHCFKVKSILLPGHGTRPGDLLNISWRDWAAAEAYGTESVAVDADEVYLLGFSTGAALSVYQTLQDPRIKGVYLFSPAMRITSMAALADIHKLYSWAFPRSRWIDLMNDEDPFKYESFPYNAAFQIFLLTREVDALRKERPFTVPLFIAASEDDSTVLFSGTREFFGAASNPKNRMIVYTTHAAGISEKVTRVNSAFPDQHILSSAHTALVLPPGSAHYGEHGDYAYCNHYFPKEIGKYEQCKMKKENYLGEISDENLKKGIIRRLMYNPNFNRLEESLARFADSLEASR